MNYSTDDELMHYGKLGMKWGRRGASTSKSVAKARRKKKPKLSKKGMQLKRNSQQKAKIKELTNAELEERIKRIELEKKLYDLKTPKSQETGQNFVKSVLLKSGNTVATQLATIIMQKGVNAMFGYEVLKTSNRPEGTKADTSEEQHKQEKVPKAAKAAKPPKPPKPQNNRKAAVVDAVWRDVTPNPAEVKVKQLLLELNNRG